MRPKHGTRERAAEDCACFRCEEKREAIWQAAPSLPAKKLQPYLPIAGGAKGTGYEHMGGIESMPERLRRKWFRAQKIGLLTPRQADDICTHLGVPTSSVFPEEWMS